MSAESLAQALTPTKGLRMGEDKAFDEDISSHSSTITDLRERCQVVQNDMTAAADKSAREMELIKADLRAKQAKCSFLSAKLSAVSRQDIENEKDAKHIDAHECVQSKNMGNILKDSKISFSSELDEENKHLKIQLSENQLVIQSLQKKVGAYEKELVEQQQARSKEVLLLREAAKLLSSVEIDRSALEIKLRDSVGTSASQIASLDDYIKKIQEEMQEIRSENVALVAEKKKMAESVVALKLDCKEKEVAIEDLKKDYGSIQSGASTAADELLAKQAENRNLKRQILVMTAQKDETDNYVQFLATQLDMKNAMLADAEACNDALMKQQDEFFTKTPGSQPLNEVQKSVSFADSSPPRGSSLSTTPSRPTLSTPILNPSSSSPRSRAAAITMSASSASAVRQPAFVLFDPESPNVTMTNIANRLEYVQAENARLVRMNEDLQARLGAFTTEFTAELSDGSPTAHADIFAHGTLQALEASRKTLSEELKSAVEALAQAQQRADLHAHENTALRARLENVAVELSGDLRHTEESFQAATQSAMAVLSLDRAKEQMSDQLEETVQALRAQLLASEQRVLDLTAQVALS